jgi:hypothetical protein
MTNLKMCQKIPATQASRSINNIPYAIKKLSENVKLFKEVLRNFLLKQSFVRWKNVLIIKPAKF